MPAYFTERLSPSEENRTYLNEQLQPTKEISVQSRSINQRQDEFLTLCEDAKDSLINDEQFDENLWLGEHDEAQAQLLGSSSMVRPTVKADDTHNHPLTLNLDKPVKVIAEKIVPIKFFSGSTAYHKAEDHLVNPIDT